MQTARKVAIDKATAGSQDVLISRDGKPTLIVRADGTFSPPPDVLIPEREVCVRDERTCFCTPCRANRKETPNV